MEQVETDREPSRVALSVGSSLIKSIKYIKSYNQFMLSFDMQTACHLTCKEHCPAGPPAQLFVANHSKAGVGAGPNF